jgi:ATP diphosphatase
MSWAECPTPDRHAAMPDVARLLEIMAALRTPGTGCPWDLEQDFASIAPYTIEEAYEVADAIAREDLADLKEELGDLLLQVVFHARMAQEQQAFGFADVVKSLNDKLVRRHPHVFGDERSLSARDVEGLWDRIKRQERESKERESQAGPRSANAPGGGALDGVPLALPALTRAFKLQSRAAKVGFDWRDPMAVLAKIREEADEIEAELVRGDREAAALEVGDLLFAAVNLSRHLGADPETGLRRTNKKFERRFARIERALANNGRLPQQATLAEMDEIWNEAKRAEGD